MTLKILGPDDPAVLALTESVREHPELDAQIDIIPWAQYRDTLLESLHATESPYQAVCVPGHIWLPELAAAGLFQPLEPLLPLVSPFTHTHYAISDLIPSVYAESRFAERWYMLPLFTDGHIVFYRSDLVSIPEQIRPSDWQKLIPGWKLPAGVSPLALKAHPSEIFLDWLPYLYEQGGDVLDENSKPAFAGPEGIRALEIYCSLRASCPADTHQYGNSEIAAALSEGKVAAAVSWGGQAAMIFDPATNPYAQTMKTASLARAWNATWGVCIPANQSKDTSLLALTRLMNVMDTDCDQKVTRIAGSPVRSSTYASAPAGRYPWLHSQHEMLLNCKTLPSKPEVGAFLGIMYDTIYQAFTGTVEPAEGLRAAAEKVTSILSGAN